MDACGTLALARPHPAGCGARARFALWGQENSECSDERLRGLRSGCVQSVLKGRCLCTGRVRDFSVGGDVRRSVKEVWPFHR